MKKLKSTLSWGALLLFVCITLKLQSCRKSNSPAGDAPPNNEATFFTVPESASGTVKRIASFIKEQNTQYHFIGQLIKKEGYVIWDKGEIYMGKKSGSLSADTIVILPMVLENTRQVNSFIACKVSGDKIAISLHRGRRYNTYSFSDKPELLTANNLTMELMFLDKKVFGDSVFQVSDPRLFARPGEAASQSRTITIRSKEPTTTSVNSWFVYTVDRCYFIGNDGDHGQLVGVAPGGSNNYAYGEWICYTATVMVFIVDDSGGGPGGGATVNPGGGGGGGGGTPASVYGWWSYDPCQVPDPNGPQEPVFDLDPNPAPCVNGVREVWHPLYPMLKINDITNEFTNPCIVAAKNKLPDNMLKIYAAELLVQSEVNDEWSIKFTENPALVSPGTTDPMPAESYPTTATKTWNVVLNPLFWEQGTQPNSTQEIAGLNILHEIIHGCIYVYKDKYGLSTLSTIATHEVMFKNFILILRQTLMNAYGLSQNDATALALQGLDDVLKKEYVTGPGGTMTLSSYDAAFNQFAIDNYGLSIPDAEVIFDQYYAGTKGTKCF